MSGNFTWREQHLYGSSRLGIWRIDTVPTAADLWKISNYSNRRQYELSNHLGNVMAVIGDYVTIVNDTTRYPSIFSLNDYYVFGATKRWSGSEGYRYGFNGKENDNELKGEGNQQDYGMRIYDPRLGKFLSVDPLTKDYPWYTPYQFAGNIPANSQAHHVFPQKFVNQFSKAGINIHDPKFGAWWNTSSHLKNASGYNQAWTQFLKTNPTQSQILDKGRQLMQQYGIPVNF